MPEHHYPRLANLPEEKSRRGGLRYYDSRKRLVALSIPDGDYILFYQVKSFRQITLPDGKKADVPAAMACTWSLCELDPNYEAPESNGSAVERREWQIPEREYEVDNDLQYNRARFCDPGVGRWIEEG
jgi:hypothetical protein